jgi:hypothetical protein
MQAKTILSWHPTSIIADAVDFIELQRRRNPLFAYQKKTLSRPMLDVPRQSSTRVPRGRSPPARSSDTNSRWARSHVATSPCALRSL